MNLSSKDGTVHLYGGIGVIHKPKLEFRLVPINLLEVKKTIPIITFQIKSWETLLKYCCERHIIPNEKYEDLYMK